MVLEAAGGSLEQFDADEAEEWLSGCAVAVDALYGTGLNADLRGDGLTAVILGLDIDAVREICAQTDCDVANDNSPGQVVISGLRETVEKTMELAKSRGAKRAMPLALSVPVHCRVQSPAADAMRAEFARLRPTALTGGFIPSVDHQTPPEVSLENYREYLRQFAAFSEL